MQSLVIGLIVRRLCIFFGVYITKHGLPALGDNTVSWVGGVFTILIGVGWGLFQKWHEHKLEPDCWKRLVAGVSRSGLDGLAGWLVNEGVTNGAPVLAVTGAFTGGFSILWSLIHKASIAPPSDPSNDSPNYPTFGGPSQIATGLLLAFLIATPSWAEVSTNFSISSGVVVPVVTPATTELSNLIVGSLTNAPNSIGATAITTLTQWFIEHGSLFSGPGIELTGDYGANVGQTVTIFDSSGTNVFIWAVDHEDFYGKKSTKDEFGTGFIYTFNAPAWLSNFAILTRKPSRLSAGLSVNYQTTDIMHGRLNYRGINFGPQLNWSF